MEKQTFLGVQSDYTESKFVILPVPMELSVSYGGGTSKGPDAILQASYQLEAYDYELNDEPLNSGVYVKESVVSKEPVVCFKQTSEEVQKIIKDKKFPIVLGGEHTLSYGVFDAVKQIYGLNDFSVLHFDAHFDLRNEYEGTPYSHACVIRRIRDAGCKDIVAVGIRSISLEEKQYRDSVNQTVFYAHELYKNFDVNLILSKLKTNVFITFDVDAFDPSLIPSTGTPEPGGLSWYPVLELLKSVFINKKVVAVDIVELAPDNINHHSEFTIAKLLYKIMAYKLLSEKNKNE